MAVQPTTDIKRDALFRYNVITLCEKFGWTIEYVKSMPLDWYHDAITILSKQAKQQ